MRTKLLALAAAAALPLLALGQASQPGAGGQGGPPGQSGQGGLPGGQPGVGSPFWDAEPTIEYVQRGPDGLPLTLIEQVPRVEYLYGVAKWSYRTAQADRIRLIDRKRDELLNGPAFVEATRAEREAWAKYQQARAQVLDELMEDSEYASLTRLQRQVELRIEAARERDRADMQQIADLARSKLAYTRQISAYQQGALEANESVDSARRVFLEAGGELLAMKRDVESQLENDPEVAELNGVIKQLRIEYLALSRFRNSTERAADRAMAYARYSRGVDRYRPVYSPYGYGYYGGYGSYGKVGYGGFFGGSNYGFTGTTFDSQLNTTSNGARFGPLPGRTPMSREPVPTQ